MPIGNDIVNLTDQLNRGKSEDRRFLSRVFTDLERRFIEAAEDPDKVLWAVWAIKEGAYKAAVKLSRYVPGVPRRYEVRCIQNSFHFPIIGSPLPGGSGWEEQRQGEVETPLGAAFFQVRWNDQVVHSLVLFGEEPRMWESIRAGFVVASPTPAHGPEGTDYVSSLLRVAVRDTLAHLLSFPGIIDIVRDRMPWGLGPPSLCSGGTVLPVDVSLSHDGDYGAYVLMVSHPSQFPLDVTVPLL